MQPSENSVPRAWQHRTVVLLLAPLRVFGGGWGAARLSGNQSLTPKPGSPWMCCPWTGEDRQAVC